MTQFAFVCLINSPSFQSKNLQTPGWEEAVAAACPRAVPGQPRTKPCQEQHQQFHKMDDPVPPLGPTSRHFWTLSYGRSLAACTNCGQPRNETLLPDMPPWKSLVGWPRLQRSLGRAQGLWKELRGSMQDSLVIKPGHTRASPPLNYVAVLMHRYGVVGGKSSL